MENYEKPQSRNLSTGRDFKQNPLEYGAVVPASRYELFHKCQCFVSVPKQLYSQLVEF